MRLFGEKKKAQPSITISVPNKCSVGVYNNNIYMKYDSTIRSHLNNETIFVQLDATVVRNVAFTSEI